MKNNTKEIVPVNTDAIGEFTAKRIDAIGTVTNVKHYEYKSAALTDYADRLALAVATTGAKSNETAAILYAIDRDKAYKEDGFNNLPDFVKASGMNAGGDSSGIYKLAKAGALLMSDCAEVATWAATCNTTALSIIGTLDSETVENAVKSGKLSNNISVKEAKDYTKSVKADKDGGKVVKCYDYSMMWHNANGLTTVQRDNIPGVDALPEAGSYTFTKVAIPSGMSADYTAAYVGIPKECNYTNHGVFMVYAKLHNVPKEAKQSKSALDLFSLDLSSMDPAQLAQLAEMVKAATGKA